MLPVDAAPFLGPTRPPDAPLSMSDAGTLAYHTHLHQAVVSSQQQQQQQTAAAAAAAAEEEVPSSSEPLRRQSRSRRTARWRDRLPMLDEDPTEDQLPHRPPGEEEGRAASLTPLGQRLVGLVEWEAAVEAVPKGEAEVCTSPET